MTCACASCRLRASWTAEQRIAFDAADLASEALEHEFIGALLKPIEYVIPLSAETLRQRKYKRRWRRDTRSKRTRLEQQQASARRRLAAHGYHMEAA